MLIVNESIDVQSADLHQSKSGSDSLRVRKVRLPQVGCYDEVSRRLCAAALYCLKLSWFSASEVAERKR